MKLSKTELKQRISDNIQDNDDLVISLLEDIEDSMVENNESIIDETQKRELEELKLKYEDLKQRYKDRFLKGEEKEETEKEETEEKEELEEVEELEKEDIFKNLDDEEE